MADEPDAPPVPSRGQRIILFAALLVGFFGITAAIAVGLIVKVDKVHAAWCNGIGLLCTKEPEKPVVVAAKPAGCPDLRMKGHLVPRRPYEPVWTVVADVSGSVSLQRGDESASGGSNISCLNNAFLATFLDMSDGVIYQCLGSISGQDYDGVCNRSMGGTGDISGKFTN